MVRIKDKIVRQSLKLFIPMVLAIAALVGLGAMVSYRADLWIFFRTTSNQERDRVAQRQNRISGAFDGIVSDLLILADQTGLACSHWQSDRHALSALADEYRAFTAHKRIYDQIRFLDDTGEERVRVNFNDGSPVVVPDAELQDKRDRYYFVEALALERGGVFVSPFDLNVEHGQIERPWKPTIRIATPVVDAVGRKCGVVVLNYLGQLLLDRLAAAGPAALGQIMLLNADGYWLRSPHPEDTWGFMVAGRAARSFDRDYPDEWLAMRRMGHGELTTEHGLFAFAQVFPLAEAYRSSTGANTADEQRLPPAKSSDPFWFLVSQVPADTIERYAARVRVPIVLLGSCFFAALAAGAWFLALAVTRRRIYKMRLIAMAHYDALTGLPNRSLFFERLERLHANAARYGGRYGLLYLDLDGFKQVNDRLGHQAGDRLLQQVGRLLSERMRQVDTVARLGGDEFAVILSAVADPGTVQRLGEELIELLRCSEYCRLGDLQVGASIGIALYPEHADTVDGIMHAADCAMYEIKRHGKNGCALAASVAPGRQG